jgi:hypothetical protein
MSFTHDESVNGRLCKRFASTARAKKSEEVNDGHRSARLTDGSIVASV